DDALAYALARLPATYAACVRVFEEAVARAPGFAPRRLLDGGAGPAAASWAALEAWPGLDQLSWLDSSPTFLQIAARLAADRSEGRRGLVPPPRPAAAQPRPPAGQGRRGPVRGRALRLSAGRAARGRRLHPGAGAGSAARRQARDRPEALHAFGP